MKIDNILLLAHIWIFLDRICNVTEEDRKTWTCIQARTRQQLFWNAVVLVYVVLLVSCYLIPNEVKICASQPVKKDQVLFMYASRVLKKYVLVESIPLSLSILNCFSYRELSVACLWRSILFLNNITEPQRPGPASRGSRLNNRFWPDT